MRLINLLGMIPVTALTIGVSSCDIEEASYETGSNNTFTVNAHVGDASASESARATVNNEDGASFMWQNDDKFDVYFSSNTSSASVFTINNETISDDKKSADFICDNFTEPSEGDKFYAFYPSEGFAQSSGTYSFTIPQEVYSQSENNNTDHLKSGLAMMATGNYADMSNGISFAQKTSLMRFGITNKRSYDVTIKSVRLVSTTYAAFGSSYSYKDKEEDAETYTVNSTNSKELSITLGGSNGITLNANGSEGSVLKAYTLTMPGAGINDNELFHIEIVLSDGSTIQSEGFFGYTINNITSEEAVPEAETMNETETGDETENEVENEAEAENINDWQPGYYYSFLLDLNEVSLDFKGVTISSFEDGGDKDLTITIE